MIIVIKGLTRNLENVKWSVSAEGFSLDRFYTF